MRNFILGALFGMVIANSGTAAAAILASLATQASQQSAAITAPAELH